MRKLIPVMNKMQDVFSSIGRKDQKIDLPQIVVVGEQSTGKSSVLESIVGHDFLPRGNGIVTRRPLILQLQKTSGPMKANLLDKLLEHKKISYPKNFSTYPEITKAIEYCTEKASPGKCILHDPIRLRVQAPDVVDLTVVDLPGITKIPVADQPKNIEKITKDLVNKYILKQNCIILAILAGNVDMANSEGIRMAKEADPSGERTLGVITKIDIMDKGTDAMDMLKGRVVPLKKGFVGVKMRSQHDIKEKKPINIALDEEERYFKTHPVYGKLSDRMGIRYLTKKLNKLLMNHIRSTLPDLRKKIDDLIVKLRVKMDQLGPSLEEGMSLQGHLLNMITKFTSDYTATIDGRNIVHQENKLFGGARINRVFFRQYLPHISSLDPIKTLKDNDIKMRIDISKGVRSGLYIPEEAFESLAKMSIKRLETPSLLCVDQVLKELVSIMDFNLKQFERYPALRDSIRNNTMKLLSQYVKPTKVHISDQIHCEMSFINTNHPDFFGGGTKVVMLMEKLRGTGENEQPQQRPSPPPPKTRTSAQEAKSSLFDPLSSRSKKKSTSKKEDDDMYSYNFKKKDKRNSGGRPALPARSISQPPKIMDRKQMEVEVIRTLLGQYFCIVQKQIGDFVPKTIMHFLVNKSCKDLHPELIREIYADKKAEALLKESDDVKRKRISTKKFMEVLLKGQSTLSELEGIEL